MRLKLTTTLLVLLIVVGGADGRVRTARVQDAKKPTPTPTPPTGGPVPTDPGGPSRNASGNRAGSSSRGFNERKTYNVGERAGARERALRSLGESYKAYDRAPRTRPRSYNPRPAALMRYTCDPEEQEQADLTGKYSGMLEFPGRDVSAATDLFIEGQKFRFVSGDQVLSGTITSTTTCNYTAVALRFEATSSSDVPKTISLQAKRVGSSLRLTSVPGETKVEFAPVPNARRQ